MQPTAARRSGRLDERLEALREHRALGGPVRFYLARREQVRYLVVGAWNTVFGYLVWAVLQALLGGRLHYLAIVLVAWPIAVLNAFVAYRTFVFRSQGPLVRELPRFALVYALTLAANLVVLPVALAILPLNIYVVQAAFAVLVVIASYLGHKYYSFGGLRRSDDRRTGGYDPPPRPEE